MNKRNCKYAFKFTIVKIGLLVLVLIGVNMMKGFLDQKPLFSREKKLQDKQVAHINTKPEGEMRAVWVPYMALDMKGSESQESEFKKRFDIIAKNAHDMHLNTLIVQVRPYADAFYCSAIYPWSHLLTGTQGKDPGYDPLQFMVERAHELGLKIHAWINPLRIQRHSVPDELCKNHDYFSLKDDKDKIINIDDEKYYNPAYPENRQKIIDGVKEIVKNYSVDGIQFDDYFYPPSETNFDNQSYEEYQNSIAKSAVPLSIGDWRCANINNLICGVYGAIKEISKEVQFGISPQGNIQNNLKIGADVYKWCATSGYVDYICPQMYVSFKHPSLPFDEMSRQWNEIKKCDSVDIYYGLGVYKAGSDLDQGTWEGSDDILRNQIEYTRKMKVGGFMLYSCEYLQKDQTANEIANVMKIL